MEIMVVVAILALIIGAVATNIGGAREKAKVSVTETLLSQIDAGLERFKLDFNAFPTLHAATPLHTQLEWSTICKALNAMGLEPGTSPPKLFAEEMHLVLMESLSDPSVLGTPGGMLALEQTYSGPYLKSRKGVSLDGFGKGLILVVDNTQGLYKLYSTGKNGVDDGGVSTSDDIISSGSQLQYP